jgi:predicted dehydrogenase/threonine dehydrogenase-like Zn-dependent dehydrogenase
LKQILQNLSNGETSLVDVPSPKSCNGSLLIASRNSLVSAGTERMLVDFSNANMFDKARQQPDKVKMVLSKAKTDGILPTIDAVRSKLDQPIPLGYCNAGVVLESGVKGYVVGDRIVSNGNHAEVVRVTKNLCAKIPDGVDDESAAFTVLAAVGLQGIRLINPTLGEAVVVSGLGLVGLMTVQMLRANGCRVLGIDFDSSRCEIARQFGAETVDLSKSEDPIAISQAFSRGHGVDAVVIAAASQNNDIVHQAAEMCRKRGRIVLIGVVGLNLIRDDFFKKEITFQVSASYGPGRYDSLYEEKGQDYPVGFVRWTEQRNFEAVLDMMDSGVLDIKPLITHRFKIEKAVKAYELLNDTATLGILLQYSIQDESILRNSIVQLKPTGACKYLPSDTIIGFIGAGNYASRILIPAFKKSGAMLDTLVTSGGLSGAHYGKKMGFRLAATELDVVWNNEVINAVVIVTRHNSHAAQVESALNSGKHIFVEKPLALSLKELNQIDVTFQRVNEGKRNPLRLMVGFNRRFSPHIVKMKSLLGNMSQPKTIIMTINAGEIPVDHWTQDSEVGGGRIIGEGCHFIDLMRHLVGHKIVDFTATMIGNVPGVEIREDKASITLSFEDGSLGTIHYLANGGSIFPKERIEVFCDNAVLQMDNYRVLTGYGWPGFKKMKLFKQDKGQKACARSFVESIANGKESPIPYNEVMESSRVSIEIANLLRN